MRTRIRDLAPDTILFGGKIVTLDPDDTLAEALAIKDGRLVAVGAGEHVKALAGTSTQMVDLRGKSVIPGLIDSHTHFLELGLQALRPSFEHCESIEDVVGVIERAAKAAAPEQWIVCAGSASRMPTKLKEHRYPTRHDLDPVSPRNPVYLPGHATIVNSLGLRLAGINRDTPDPVGGRIVRDETAEPTGVLLQTAGWIVKNLAPLPTQEELAQAIVAGCDMYSAVGVTSVGFHGARWDELAAYTRARAEGTLRVRHYLHLLVDHTAGMPEIEAALDHLAFAAAPGFGDEWLKLGGIKIFFDGGVGLGTALLREPYVTGDGTTGLGVQCIPTETFKTIAEAAVRRGLRLAVHNSGGRAIDIVYGVLEELAERYPLAEQRFIAVHSQLPSEANMQQAKRLGFTPAIQTVFMNVNGAGYLRFLGHDLAQRANPVRSWLEHDVPVGLGSDATINPYNPFRGIWHAMTRLDETTGQVIGSDERITRKQALRCYTAHNARISFEEDLKGSLEPGKLADLVVLDRDILTCPVDEIREIHPLLTIVGGQATFGVLEQQSLG